MTRPPSTAMYGRRSKGIDAQPNSIAAQVRGMLPKIQWLGLPLLAESSPDEQPGLFTDLDTSAYKTRFASRPGGKLLLETLRPGDCLVVHRLDRLCRSMSDFCNVSQDLLKRGIRLIVCEPGIDLGSADGRLVAHQLAAMAEWESARKSERIRDALAAKRTREGKPPKTRKSNAPATPSDWRPVDAPASTLPPGRLHIYLRCSHRDSAESGLGIEHQLQVATAYRDHLTAMHPQLTAGEVIQDLAVSAYSRPLRERPGGRVLDGLLKSGDHVVFLSLDRGFRSVRDMANTIPDWLARGIDVHFASSGMRMSDATGRLLAGILTQFAEFESFLTSRRTKDAKAISAAQGIYSGGKVPLFWKLRRRDKKLVLDRARMAQFRLLRLWRSGSDPTVTPSGDRVAARKPVSLVAALAKLESLLARRRGRIEIPACGIDRSSRLSNLLPANWPRDRKGRAFPAWTRHDFNKSIDAYDRVMLLRHTKRRRAIVGEM